MNFNGLLEQISLFILNTPITQKEFTRQLRYVLAHTAKKEFPNISISEIASISGLTRGKVSDFLDEEPPRQEVNKEALILNDLWSIKDSNNLVPMEGENSFKSVCHKIKIDYSSDIAMNNLIIAQCIEISGGKLKILKPDLIFNNFRQNQLRILNKTSLKLTRTILNNIFNEEKMFQRSYVSKSVHPKNFNNLSKEICELLDQFLMNEIREAVERYEEDGVYNFPEYMVSLFENFHKQIR